MTFRAYTMYCFGLFLLTTACSDLVPLWKGTCTPEEYALAGDSAACSYIVHFDSLAPIMYVQLKLEVHYDIQVGRNAIALAVVLEKAQDSSPSLSHSVLIPIRDAAGWKGYSLENDREYLVTHLVPDLIQVNPGEYRLYIKAQNPDLGFIPGILEVVARFFPV